MRNRLVKTSNCKRRHLTLLEVLISFTLIVLCLFPLLSPHVTYYQTQTKLARSIRTNLAVNNWYASFYEALLKKERTWDSLPFEVPKLIKDDQKIEDIPDNATYIVSIEKDKIGDTESLYLLKLSVDLGKPENLTYYFVVKRKNDESQEATSNPA